jgi:hypothetical protein
MRERVSGPLDAQSFALRADATPSGGPPGSSRVDGLSITLGALPPYSLPLPLERLATLVAPLHGGQRGQSGIILAGGSEVCRRAHR